LGLRKDVAWELVAAAVLALVFCVMLCVRTCVRARTGRRPGIWLLPVFVFFVAGGFMRSCAVCREETAWLAAAKDGWLCCEGTVKSMRQRKEQWEVALQVTPGYSAHPASGRLLVYLDENLFGEDERPRIGSRMRVAGKVKPFDAARNPGEFDFRNYYRARRMYLRMSADTCEKVGNRYDLVGDGLFEIVSSAGEILDQTAPPRYAGIFRAAVLGDKSGLEEGVRRLYQKSGISHLLAVSGLHLSMVSMAAYGCFRMAGMGFGKAGAAGGILLIVYGIMTGGQPSVVRALVMALCGYLAAYLGRTYDLLSALGLAGIVICLESP